MVALRLVLLTEQTHHGGASAGVWPALASVHLDAVKLRARHPDGWRHPTSLFTPTAGHRPLMFGVGEPVKPYLYPFTATQANRGV